MARKKKKKGNSAVYRWAKAKAHITLFSTDCKHQRKNVMKKTQQLYTAKDKETKKKHNIERNILT